MFISWDPPYTLPGLTVQYIISVETEKYELNSTNYTYCPSNLTNKEYQFNITTSNGAGKGFTSNITVGSSGIYFYSFYDMFLIIFIVYIPEAHLTVAYNHNNTYLIGNEWVFSYQLEVSISFNHYYTSIITEPSILYSTYCNGDSDQ